MSWQNTNIITLSEKVGKTLLEKKLKLVTAESCTGGGLSYALTEIPGSSHWFERGFVTYSNEAKQELLQVADIKKNGAVSEHTAIAMAEGALKNSHGDIAVSITGIAGPKGGTKDKPVGTVWFGLAGNSLVHKTIYKLFTGNRSEIRAQTIEFSLTWLISYFESD